MKKTFVKQFDSIQKLYAYKKAVMRNRKHVAFYWTRNLDKTYTLEIVYEN